MCVPIVLFVYNRIEHTRKTIEALQKCTMADKSNLYIYSDGAAPGAEISVAKVRKYIYHIDGFKKVVIIERKENLGIEKSEISAITELLDIYPSLIILEDDLIVENSFLKYMNEALDKFFMEKNVLYISGYSYLEKKTRELPDCFLLGIPSTWGWATWRDRWSYFRENPSDCDVEKIIYDKKNLRRYCFDNAQKTWGKLLIQQYKSKKYTWDVSWHVTLFNNNGSVLIPNQTLVQNIGFDGSGVHKEKRKINRDNTFDPNIEIKTYPDKGEVSDVISRKVSKIMKRQNRIESIKRKLHLNGR